jgi:hypothetical protein
LQIQSQRLVDIIQAGDMKSFAKYTSILTVSNASAGTKVLRLKNLIGPDNLNDLLIVLISDVVSFFNLPDGKNMNSDQVVFSASAIIEDYPLFSLEDFTLCFKKGKTGKYGKNYSSFDGQILFSWLKAYDLERDECLSAENQSASLKAPKEPILPGVFIDSLYKEFGAPIEEEKKAKEAEFQRIKAEWYKQQLKSKGNDSDPNP